MPDMAYVVGSAISAGHLTALRFPLTVIQGKTMQVYYDKDCDLSIIQGKKVAIIGYGSQGHAHALNLRDSGVEVVVGLRPNSASRQKAAIARLAVADIASAVQQADIVMMLLPDEDIARVYEQEEIGRAHV